MTSSINPRVDLAFKKIFGVEENKDLLISLINSIVSEEDQVIEVTLLNPYNLASFKTDKLSILDVKAKGTDGKRFNIEIQITDEADYDKRALYYWAKLYSEQLAAGDDYAKLSKAIGIHILNFTSISDAPKYHNVFHITEKESGFSYFKDLELHTIELKKFDGLADANLADMVEMVKTALDMWVAFLMRHDLLDKDHLPNTLSSPELQKALNVLDVMSFSSEERYAYEDRLKWLRIETNTLNKRFNDGKAEGLVEGKAEGLVEGEARGIEKGLREAAKKLLSIGKDRKDVALLLGLRDNDF